MRRLGPRLPLALLGAAVVLAVIMPLPVPPRLVYPNSPLYPLAVVAALVWLWFKDRAGLRIFLASIIIFELLHLALFTALPASVLRAPIGIYDFPPPWFTALDQHRSGPSEFFGLVAVLWAVGFARNRSPAAQWLSGGALICLERVPVPLGFFLLHGALGAGLAGVALLIGARIERVRWALPRLPVWLAYLLASAATIAVMMPMGPYEAPAIDLLVASVLAAIWLFVVFCVPDARPRPAAAVYGWA